MLSTVNMVKEQCHVVQFVGNLTGQGQLWQKWTRIDNTHNAIMFRIPTGTF